jgi:hypothetical protein
MSYGSLHNQYHIRIVSLEDLKTLSSFPVTTAFPDGEQRVSILGFIRINETTLYHLIGSNDALRGAIHQARTGRGIHGLPKVSPRPGIPNLYTPPWIPLPVQACFGGPSAWPVQ